MTNLNEIMILKKDNVTKERFNSDKIINAVKKSASRTMVKLTELELHSIVKNVEKMVIDSKEKIIPIITMHNIVEKSISMVNEEVAKSYREYRNYKEKFVRILDDVYQKSKAIRYIGDKENANSDSALVATKRSLIYNQLNKELYQAFFLNPTEVQACRDGYIYIHDMSARLDGANCCLSRIGDILKDGFEMGNVWYNEPNSLDTAFDVMGDVILSAAAQQYGGFTVPQLDKILVPYAEKSYKLHFNENVKIIKDVFNIDILTEEHLEQIERISEEKVQREFEQGFQGLEYKLNTVGSSRGDYPFITVTTGLSTNKWGIMASKTMLRVHMGGQGKKGFKKPVLFPKYVFLYDEELHGEGKILEEVFDVAVECSSKTMYPDFLSLSGEGYVPSMYKQYGEVVSPMGKASLQPM